MSYKGKQCKKLITLFFIIILSLLLTGCGNIKNSKDIIKFIRNEYNIDVEVISFIENNSSNEKEKHYNNFILKEKNREITFSATSYFSPINVDGSTFGHQERTSDNYYEKLTESIQDELSNIANQYQIEFEYWNDGLVSSANFLTQSPNSLDLETISTAINEIMKLYNLKREPSDSTTVILIYANNKDTDYYFNYTTYGKNSEIINSEQEFMKTWNIPEQMKEDVLTYLNTLYSGDCYIVETSVIPASFHGETEDKNYVSYIIKNDTLKFKKEFRFALDQYREDLKNNTLTDMRIYMETGITYVYD